MNEILPDDIIPGYHLWPETEQERYRLSVPKEQDFLIRQTVLRSLFDFETLGDLARYDHKFQEQARRAEDPAYDIRLYQGDLHPCWGG